MRLFKKLRRKLSYLPNDQVEEIYQAYLLADKAHQDQKRYTGEPYITHPLAVAEILAEICMDKQTIMAALMHDVIEDTEYSKEQLAMQFGDTVAELVDGVSKLTQIEFKSRIEAQAENFSKMVLAMSRDIRVIIVKLADRLHNMRTLEPLPPPKRRRIAQETLEIYAPIANRLGMHTFYLELEELGFFCLHPSRYQILKEAVRKALGNRKEVMNVIFKSLKNGLSKQGLQEFQVAGREKHLYSIYKKMRIKHLPFSEIMDVYAFRIVVDSVDSCYRVLGIVHSLYKPISERFKDYIALPKPNGYQSLHTTLFGPYGVPIEIQIRTSEMDEMANNGIAAHWLYKTGSKKQDFSEVQQQQWLKNLLEMQQRTGNSLEFIENVKVDLFPEEVYVFTPDGKIMQLPSGATPVDFAYAVHTDVGNCCVAAKIDRQLAPLSTVLLNGQTVEIITSKNARPNPAWLDFVVTGKARSSLRHYLKVQRRTQSISFGKRLLNKALEHFSLSLKKIPAEELDIILTEAKLNSLDDLLQEIGLGNRAPKIVAHRIAKEISADKKNIVQKSQEPLLIQGTEGVVVKFATCCYPLPGDPIMGVLQSGEGVLVHAEFCSQIAKRLDTEECMPVRWATEVKGEFPVQVTAEVLNRRGVLGDMALAVSDADANIDDIRVYERDGNHYQVAFELLVKDRMQLANVIRNLRRVKAIVHIKRGGTNP